MDSMMTVARAAPGGYVGSGHVHPALLDAAREHVAAARSDGLIRDSYVCRCGGDVVLVLWHDATRSRDVAEMAEATVRRAAEVGRDLGQHGADEPHVTRLASASFRVRASEPVCCFLASGAGPGAWDLALYRIFADPMNTRGLGMGRMRAGFRFTLGHGASAAGFDVPEELYGLSAAVTEGLTAVSQVCSREYGSLAATATATDDPTLIVRCHDEFPAVADVLEGFAQPTLVPGAAGVGPQPLVPVSVNEDGSSRADGPARVIGLGFQLTDERLVGPRDLLADFAFDAARRHGSRLAAELRRARPIAPAAPAATSDAAPQPRLTVAPAARGAHA